jgi:hypothetical protein
MEQNATKENVLTGATSSGLQPISTEDQFIQKKLKESPSMADFTPLSMENEEKSYANAIQERLNQLNNLVEQSEPATNSIKEEENSNIAKLRQMIANLQVGMLVFHTHNYIEF